MHRELAIEALRQGESLNTHCVHLLREARTRYGKKGQS
ncbi:MAG TPA: hypothetical protein PK991_08710 [Candidatus Sabulitectum sp.]|nr:hypothetical protein [Candidatus Sabulitectum sp.]